MWGAYEEETPVNEIAVNSSGDEFLDVLLKRHEQASREAEKASAIARKAEQDHQRASWKLDAIEAAVDAYRNAWRSQQDRED